MPWSSPSPCWRSRRGRELVATGLLLAFCVASILVLSHVLGAASRLRPAAAPADAAPAGEVAKPVLYPPPEPLLDLPRFSYLLNADPCADGDVTGVLVVTSHLEHVELRSAHRRAYPRSELLRLGLRRVFLLAARPPAPAASSSEWPDRALQDEGRRFHDIVQGDFHEAYRNLTYKHTMGLRWAARYCPQARFVLKMDDDIVVDLYQFVDLLKEQPAAALSSSVLGYVLHALRPSREPANKWFVTRAEYGGEVYPDFVSGWLYATTPGVARVLADAAARWTARERRYFWIDDLLLTGIVREQAVGAAEPVTLRDASGRYTVHPEVIKCCLAEPDLRCDVLAGPNGGDNDLIVRLQAHASRCQSSCRPRPPGRSVEQACVVRADQADGRLPAQGHGQVLGQAEQVRMF